MQTKRSVIAGMAFFLAGLPTRVLALDAPAHIVVVVEENHGFHQVVGNPDMPFLNNALIAGGLLLTDSHAVEHPSQPNYLDLFSGDNQQVVSDGPVPGSGMDPEQQRPLTSANIAAALIHAGHSFRAYSQSLPAAGSLAYYSDGKHSYRHVPADNPGAFLYARKHNPWTNWQAVSGYAQPGNHSSTLPAGVNLPLSAFPSDFNQLPTLAFVMPNQCNDMHGGVSGSSTTENCPYSGRSGDRNDVRLARNADRFLRRRLGAYAAWAKTHHSLLIVTWDENFSLFGDNHIATLFYGAGIRPGSRSAQPVNHFNLLATLGAYYRLDLSRLGQAAQAAPIAAALSAH